MADDREKRNRLEALQAEVAALEKAHHELALELTSARMTADDAEAREAELKEQHRALLRERGIVEPTAAVVGKSLLRYVLIGLVVVAVFGTVIGTVVYTIKEHFDAVIAARKARPPDGEP
jgi:hypothetical protein